jgi:hypothetical protein
MSRKLVERHLKDTTLICAKRENILADAKK